MVQKRKLNRGLEALLGASVAAKPSQAATGTADTQDASEPSAPLSEIPIEQLQRGVYQPRSEFEPEALDTLAASIKAQGILQPVVVRPISQHRYEILSGERRWRAAQLAGLDRVPVVIRDVPDEDAIAIALIENIQREDLNPVEEAFGLKRLQDEFGLNQEQIAQAVGRSRSAVANSLRLLNLHGDIQKMLGQGAIEVGHAKVLLGLDSADQLRAARQVAKRGLSVRQTEALVKSWGGDAAVKPNKDPNVSRLEQDLSDRFGARVRIHHQQNGRGRLEIQYTTLDELDGILKRLD
jgi:ParB family chromosome partitioning protein